MSDATTREFEFVEGTSNKFWKITTDGLAHTVHYGRVGTAGQLQSKEFDTPALAKTSAEKLIAEKLKKGYHETTSGATAPAPTQTVELPSVNEVNLLEVERKVILTEEDYTYAGLRPRPRKTLPVPPPFDREAVILKMKEKFKDHGWQNYDYPVEDPISREEAFLWISAFLFKKSNIISSSAQQLTDHLTSVVITDKIIIDDKSRRWVSSLLALTFRVLSPEEFGVYVTTSILDTNSYDASSTIETLRTKILPFASDDYVARMKGAVLTLFDPGAGKIIELIALLVLLGERDKTIDWIRSRTSPYAGSYTPDCLTKAIIWLGDPEIAYAKITGLNVAFTSVTLARAWLALTQCQGLEQVAYSVKDQYSNDDRAAMIKTAGRVIAPETAPYMLDWQATGNAISVCKAWFETNPKEAAASLISIAAGADKPRADLAIGVLKGLTRRGHENLVRAHLGTLSEDDRNRISPEILGLLDEEPRHEPLKEDETPQALKVDSSANSKSKPGDLLPDELPELVVSTENGTRRLANEHFYTLLHALAKSTPAQPTPYVSAVRDTVTLQSRDAFAWAVFQAWIAGGAPPKDKWMLFTVGLLGGDQCALKLTPLVRQWPGESQHVRAKLGIECLEAIGTDTALMQINGIAQKVPFKALKEAAIKSMEGVAKKRGFTRPELEDRIVPDCGLDERGSRTFDFGPRQFALSVNSDMKPVLRELKDGKPLPKLLTDLPKPNLKDDQTKSEEAVAEWKTLKKQVAETAKIQAVRLEQGMVTDRRWSAEEFDMLLVHHPLITNIVRLLLWGVFGDDGKLIQSFRITEDLTAADSSDDVYAIPSAAKIGVVHPLQLTDADKNAWGEIWSDYELVPPFPQLGRPTYALTPEEAEVTDLKRFSSVTLPAATLIFTLEKLSWLRGVPADAGGFNEHAKPFYAAGITAIVNYDPGSYVSYITESEDQKITEVYFIPRIYVPDEWWPAHKKRVPWKKIDPVVVSEVLADLSAIVAKAK